MASRRGHHEDPFNPWPAFTDLMVNVLWIVMFLLVFIILRDVAVFGPVSKMVGRVNKEIAGIKDLIKEQGAEVDDQGSIRISDAVLFDHNKAELRPKGQEHLYKIGIKLRDFLEAQRQAVRQAGGGGSVQGRDVFAILVEGYADSTGSDAHNYSLTYSRAMAIINYWESIGFSIQNYDITPVGLGKVTRGLRVHGGSIEEQAPNRRIEIRLVPKFAELIKAYGVTTEGQPRQ